MGLIRCTLNVTTLGAVKSKSRKQRIAAQSLKTQQAILHQLQIQNGTAPQPKRALTPAELRASIIAKGQDPRPVWERDRVTAGAPLPSWHTPDHPVRSA